MISWAHLIWIFFPIPFLCLILLSIPGPRRIEKFGTRAVEKIFFTTIHAGPIQIHLLWLFFLASVCIFASSVQKLRVNGVCTTCKFQSEAIWYTKALKYRAERNFWLSLFTSFLWILVWKIYSLKNFILNLKEKTAELESKLALEVGQKGDKKND